MSLVETFRTVRPCIAALASLHVDVPEGQAGVAFPTILGTGFVVDPRGLLITNRHVVESLMRIPPLPGQSEPAIIALLYEPEERDGEMTWQKIIPVHLLASFCPQEFQDRGYYYGQRVPDIAVIQLAVQDLPYLTLNADDNVLEIGRAIATAGFAMGRDALIVYEQLNQVTPFLRRGIISSVYPFPGPAPHGFTIDIMGSPLSQVGRFEGPRRCSARSGRRMSVVSGSNAGVKSSTTRPT